MDNSFKVKLRGPNGIVIFEASAPVQEDRSATYGNYSIAHLPATIHAYHSTSSRRLTVTGKLVSRNADEAAENALYLDLIRSWILPEFGSTGATPPILYLSAYKNDNITNLQVILSQYSWSFTDEVDYIWAPSGPMPVIGMISINLEEVYSAEQITAGKWRTKLSRGGKFDDSYDIPSNIDRKLVNGTLSPDRVFPVEGALMAQGMLGSQTGPGIRPTIAGVLAGRLARNLGTKILNSPAVREITKGLPPILSNIFVSGSNIAIGQVGKIVTTGVSSIKVPSAPVAPGFNRDAPLVPQGFTRDN